MGKKKYPQHWTEIDWDCFPMEIEWRGLKLTPHSFVDTFYDDCGDPILYPEFHEEILHAFKWDYVIRKGYYMGQYLSFGIYYGYPKCCIYDFTFIKRKNRHPHASDYVDYTNENKIEIGGWILCHACAEYVAEHGLEQYLKEKAWERDDDIIG